MGVLLKIHLSDTSTCEISILSGITHLLYRKYNYVVFRFCNCTALHPKEKSASGIIQLLFIYLFLTITAWGLDFTCDVKPNRHKAVRCHSCHMYFWIKKEKMNSSSAFLSILHSQVSFSQHEPHFKSISFKNIHLNWARGNISISSMIYQASSILLHVLKSVRMALWPTGSLWLIYHEVTVINGEVSRETEDGWSWVKGNITEATPDLQEHSRPPEGPSVRRR